MPDLLPETPLLPSESTQPSGSEYGGSDYDRSIPAGIRLVMITPSGQGYDLTDQCEGLSWSNVNPGGDERCGFQLKRQWFAGAPEVAMGNTVRVTCGLDVLFQGRIDENDRAVADSEQIGITAYGMGILLKDDATYREMIVDRDLSRWGGASVQNRINYASTYALADGSTQADTTTGAPSLAEEISQQPWSGAGKPRVQAWYDAGPGLLIGSVYYAWMKNANVDATDTGWVWQVRASTDDVETSLDSSGSLRAAGPGSGTLTTTGGNKRFAEAEFLKTADSATSSDATYGLYWTCLAVYGNHSLTKRGSEDATNAKGFYASDVVPYIVAKVSGLTARRVDATTFVIPQLAWLTGVTHEQAIIDTTRFEQVDWGTWGPDSALDASTTGYFDMTARDPTTQHWYCLRSECDDVALNVENSTLYTTVDVVYTDAAGVTGIETRTQASQEPGTLGRKATLQGGTLTQAGAQDMGDDFLALSAGYAPARGSVTLSQPVSHYRRGRVAPWYMRADGSNLRLPDVLPSKDLFALSAAPDRRTTFPIRRVSVDCSGQTPKVSVELDQSNDTLAVLQAQQEVRAQVAVGR